MESDDTFEQEAINAILLEINANSPVVKAWEREVCLIHDRLMADPSRAIPIEQVVAHLEARRRERR